MNRQKTNFIPVDSEHFSIWHALNENLNSNLVKKIYLTASGGPLLNIPLSKFKNIKHKQVLKHQIGKWEKNICKFATIMNKFLKL